MSTGPLRLSLSQPAALRWSGIRYNASGAYVDPRPLFAVQFQLIVPGATSFAPSWAPGTWDSIVPSTGPFSATITIGPGQPSAVNPGVAGTYLLAARFFQSVGETPTWENLRTVILEVP